MLDYATVKLVHQAAVVLSLTGFVARGVAGLAGAGWVGSRAARTLPQLIDTMLLVSALALVWMLRLTLDNAPWLVSKIAGLLLYIGLGVLALRARRPLRLRAAAWVAALLTAIWIVSVAVTKNPAGFFGALVGSAS